jgi:hypothetical protein
MRSEDMKLIAALTAAFAIVLTDASVARDHRPALRVAHDGLSARASLGTHCTTPPAGEPGFAGCADYLYPLRLRANLPVRAEGTLTLRTRFAARTLAASLLSVDGRNITPVGDHLVVRRTAARRWTVKLPAQLDGANVLSVSMTWRNARDGRGDANFWTGIRPDCAQPAR